MATQPFYAYLRNSSESEDLTENGSSTPVPYDYTATQKVKIYRMIGLIQDGGAPFQASGYGASSALSNGLTFDLKRTDSTAEDLLGGRNIFTNAGWGAVCYDIQYFSPGTGDNYQLIRWTFTNAGTPITLDIGDALIMTINDNLTFLTHHRYQLQGITI